MPADLKMWEQDVEVMKALTSGLKTPDALAMRNGFRKAIDGGALLSSADPSEALGFHFAQRLKEAFRLYYELGLELDEAHGPEPDRMLRPGGGGPTPPLSVALDPAGNNDESVLIDRRTGEIVGRESIPRPSLPAVDPRKFSSYDPKY